MTSFSNSIHYLNSPESNLELNYYERETSTFSRGSITVGDYEYRVSPSTSYLVDLNYKLMPYKSLKYQGLQELIFSWMNESSDYDIKEWPKTEQELKDHRLKFPHDI